MRATLIRLTLTLISPFLQRQSKTSEQFFPGFVSDVAAHLGVLPNPLPGDLIWIKLEV